jgi:hypothetical protein
MLPNQNELEQAAEAFDRDWGGVDEVLYGICLAHPGHSVRREVTAKVTLVDRAYSAGLERQVIPDAGSQAITKIADFMVDHGPEIDAIITKLTPLQEPLDGKVMTEIARVHRRFMELLCQIPTHDTSPRSFAAKYLHFHRPIVPIYDSYAAARLVKLMPWPAGKPAPEPPTDADAEYWDFCARFLRLYKACDKAGILVSVKGLDTYLWAVPGAK